MIGTSIICTNSGGAAACLDWVDVVKLILVEIGASCHISITWGSSVGIVNNCTCFLFKKIYMVHLYI